MFSLSLARGTGAGILNPLSAFFAGLLELGPLSVPVGACAVFMLEKGLKLLFGLGFSGIVSCWAAAFSALDPIFSYDWKGFLKPLPWGELLACCGGVEWRLLGAGVKPSSSTLTKLDGNIPIALGSRRSLPIHQRPSPALSASMRSPSTKPRSRFVSPPHEYVALTQQGKRAGRSGGAPMASSVCITGVCIGVL
jgi:hypothetical protein